MTTRPQLIAYADRLAGTLAGLGEMLDGPLAGMFSGVHILPFFDPIDGSDAGFDPIDHTRVDPRLGDWSAVRAIADRYHVCADLIVNHVSARSDAFVDWQAHGAASPHDGMFLTFDKVFPDGATEAEITAIYRPRPGLCFTVYGVAGRPRLVWTTFTATQIDIDVEHPTASRYLDAVLDRLAAAGVGTVRIDAVGYAIKRAGTSSFMLDETFALISELRGRCARRGMETLVEIHGHHAIQLDVARHVDWVYDFATPPLLLHALAAGDATPLITWFEQRPDNSIVVLDTHDGIGMTDVGRNQARPDQHGLLAMTDVRALIEHVHTQTRGTSRRPTGLPADDRDLYQINTTFLDALGGNEHDYLLCRLVQLFLPGRPQVYYCGLLGGTNDVALFEATGVGRDVNRHHYTSDEVAAALETSLVRRLGALLRWRNRAAEFDGTFTLGGDATTTTWSWTNAHRAARLTVDFATHAWHLDLRDGDVHRRVTELTELDGPAPPPA